MFLIPLLLKFGMSERLAKILSPFLVVLVVAGTYAGTYLYGQHVEAGKWEAKVTEYEQKLTKNKLVFDGLVATMKSDNEQLVLVLEERLKASEARKDRIKIVIKEVPKYVTPKADSQCVLTQGVEYVIDAALQPEAPVPVDVDASTGLTLSQLSAITASNMSECVVRGDVIQAWQEWYAKTKKTWDDVRAATPKDPEIPH